jgi:hypothetical protein
MRRVRAHGCEPRPPRGPPQTIHSARFALAGGVMGAESHAVAGGMHSFLTEFAWGLSMHWQAESGMGSVASKKKISKSWHIRRLRSMGGPTPQSIWHSDCSRAAPHSRHRPRNRHSVLSGLGGAHVGGSVSFFHVPSEKRSCHEIEKFARAMVLVNWTRIANGCGNKQPGQGASSKETRGRSCGAREAGCCGACCSGHPGPRSACYPRCRAACCGYSGAGCPLGGCARIGD